MLSFACSATIHAFAFSGVIHERMQDGVDAVCRSDGLEIGFCDVALHHIGYEGGQRHKITRNVPLLRDLPRQGSQAASIAGGISARCCYFAGDENGAAEAWQWRHRGRARAQSAERSRPATPCHSSHSFC